MSANVWRHNLRVVWASQFLAILGFSFAMPFAPFYFQDLGVTDPVRLRWWVAAFAAATPLTLMIASPLWGKLADRHGRKLMLLRANLGGALVVAGMGMVSAPWQLIALRLGQGLFTGTITAAQALVVGGSPGARRGYALGSLSAAVFSGTMTGAFAGGFFAHAFGNRGAFFASSAFMLAAAALVLFGARETLPLHSVPAVPPHAPPPAPGAGVAPILALIGLVAFTRQMDLPYVPLRVQEIHGGSEGAEIWSGALSAVGGLAGLLAGFLLGPQVDRRSAARMGLVCAALAAAGMLGQAFTPGFGGLFPSRLLLVFSAAGLEPVVLAQLTHRAPSARHGVVFGYASSARSIGWLAASAVAGVVAAQWNLQALFLLGAAAYVVVGLVMARMFAAARPAADAAAASARGEEWV